MPPAPRPAAGFKGEESKLKGSMSALTKQARIQQEALARAMQVQAKKHKKAEEMRLAAEAEA